VLGKLVNKNDSQNGIYVAALLVSLAIFQLTNAIYVAALLLSLAMCFISLMNHYQVG
jgi:hypothetical protein